MLRNAIALIKDSTLNPTDQKNVFHWWNALYLRAIATRATPIGPETQPLATDHDDDSLHLPQKLLT